MTTSKIAIGSVQFGLKYGINNKSGKTSEEEVAKILDLAQNNGINIVDTAAVYGESEEVLGKLLPAEFMVVSKLPASMQPAKVEEAFNASLKRLKRESLYGYMLHNSNDLLETPAIWKELELLKQKGLVKKIGYSLYKPSVLDELCNRGMVPDLVQFPYNLLDRQFDDRMNFLKQHHIEVHTRSTFLQGVFLMEELPAALQPIRPSLEQIRKIAREHGLAVNALALGFVTGNVNIDKVVIGVETAGQLAENLQEANVNIAESVFEEVRNIVVSDPELLNPVNWTKR